MTFEEMFKTSQNIKDIIRIKNSLNSFIYSGKIDGKQIIIKVYKTNEDIRLKRELFSLKKLEEKGFEFTPQIIDFNIDKNFIVMSKINGSRPTKNINNIIKLGKNINTINNLIFEKDYLSFYSAAEAAFSINEHFEVISKKISNQLEILKKNQKNLKLINDLKLNILPWISNYKSYIKNNIDINKKLDSKDCIFSQSDIGFHNSMINENNLYTFDYEYSGIDDPAKTFCDILIHPDQLFELPTSIEISEKLRKIKIFKNVYDRIKILIPIYRYKWFSIILNGYIKEPENNKKNESFFLEKSKNYLIKSDRIVKNLSNDINFEI